jgi:hypothetical protein
VLTVGEHSPGEEDDLPAEAANVEHGRRYAAAVSGAPGRSGCRLYPEISNT